MHLFLEDKARPQHQLLFDNRDDQHPVLFARLGHGLDDAPDRDVLDFHGVAAQLALHRLVSRLDTRADKHPVGLNLPRADHGSFLQDRNHGLRPWFVGLRHVSAPIAVLWFL